MVPGNPTRSSGLYSHLHSHAHILPPTQTHKLKNKKIISLEINLKIKRKLTLKSRNQKKILKKPKFQKLEDKCTLALTKGGTERHLETNKPLDSIKLSHQVQEP